MQNALRHAQVREEGRTARRGRERSPTAGRTGQGDKPFRHSFCCKIGFVFSDGVLDGPSCPQPSSDFSYQRKSVPGAPAERTLRRSVQSFARSLRIRHFGRTPCNKLGSFFQIAFCVLSSSPRQSCGFPCAGAAASSRNRVRLRVIVRMSDEYRVLNTERRVGCGLVHRSLWRRRIELRPSGARSRSRSICTHYAL